MFTFIDELVFKEIKMANLNYQTRLANLQSRRYDPDLQKSILSESFRKVQIPEDLKYLAESMVPIDVAYNEKTISAANNVKTHLEKRFNLTFSRSYRYQGSVMTRTNIRTHSDIDLLAIIDDYFYLPNDVSPESPYQGNPKSDINELKSQIVKILKDIYDEVDDSSSKCIAIYNKNLRRKVDIVPCYWYNSKQYITEQNEYYRGVYLYDFDKDQRTKKDFPFAHIHQVQQKGDDTIDGMRKGIRLLKTLKADSEKNIELSSFQLTSIVYDMESSKLYYRKGLELQIAENISSHLYKIIEEPNYRKNIKSPNGIEYPLFNDDLITSLSLLKSDLDDLITDCKGELKNYLVEQSFKSY